MVDEGEVIEGETRLEVYRFLPLGGVSERGRRGRVLIGLNFPARKSSSLQQTENISTAMIYNHSYTINDFRNGQTVCGGR